MFADYMAFKVAGAMLFLQGAISSFGVSSTSVCFVSGSTPFRSIFLRAVKVSPSWTHLRPARWDAQLDDSKSQLRAVTPAIIPRDPGDPGSRVGRPS